jgi:hypothetical protein
VTGFDPAQILPVGPRVPTDHQRILVLKRRSGNDRCAVEI